MENNTTPLHNAASRGDFNLAKEIYDKTPQFAEATDNRGRLALHLASARGYTKIASLLVLNDDLDTCSVRDADGKNPLHLAAMNGNVEVLNVLIQKSPNAAEARAGRGQTILHICFKYNQKEAIKLLLENAKVQELINAKDDDGNTLLHLVVAEQSTTTVNKEIVKSLLACPDIDANAKNSRGDTPLDVAIKSEEKLKKLKMDRTVAELIVIALRGENAQTAKELGRNHWMAEKRGSLMVVASLIAAMAYQAGVTPPGGLFQDNGDHHSAGDSVLAVRDPYQFSTFFESNTVGFIGSLTVIMFLLSDLPFQDKYFMWVLMAIMAVTITAVANTYVLAVGTLTLSGAAAEEVSTTLNTGVNIWMYAMGVLALFDIIRICVRLRKVRNIKFYILVSKKKMGFGKRHVSSPANGASVHPV